jgi:hypothetical protein
MAKGTPPTEECPSAVPAGQAVAPVTELPFLVT